MSESGDPMAMRFIGVLAGAATVDWQPEETTARLRVIY